MSTHQTTWPCFPNEVAVPRPAYVTESYTGVAWMHPFYNTPIVQPEESRKFLLDRSVFYLVDSHPYLALTDPRLLGWYLHLSPLDRKIIQDNGGFHQFLQRHPALELSGHHVYVKRGRDVLHSLLNYTKSGDGPQKWPCEEISHMEQPVHAQEDFQQPPMWESSRDQHFSLHSSATAGMDGAGWQSSVDVELERARQAGQPAFRGQGADFTYAEVSPSQTQCPTVEWGPSSAETAGDDEACLHCGDQIDNFSNIMEDDMSILACLPSKDGSVHNDGVHSSGGTTASEALAASSETLKCDQSVIEVKNAERSTSPMPCTLTCDIMVCTEPTLCIARSSQTQDTGASDKHVNTEVYMEDLDYLAEKCMELKMVEDELAALKEEMRRMRKDCDCMMRAQRAELSLLALQYSMCKQHCWRFYYSTLCVGDQLSPLPKDPPALQKLESDYIEMRDRILAGAPLEQLKPLSVDLEKITTRAVYIPAQIICDVLGNPTWYGCGSQEPHNTAAEDDGSPDDTCSDTCQQTPRQEQEKNGKASGAVTVVPQRELNTSEEWYDAEEDLDSPGPAVAAENRQGPAALMKDVASESTSEESSSSVLCGSNKASNVTELIVEPILGSSNRIREVCSSPTAGGACVPQHYGTMGGFDTLMTQLTQCHPDVSRQRIVDVLIELKPKHGDALSTVMEMTSELLARPSGATHHAC